MISYALVYALDKKLKKKNKEAGHKKTTVCLILPHNCCFLYVTLEPS